MESHQNAFIRYFIVKQELPIICKYVVENKGNNYKVSIWDGKCFCVIYATKDIEDIMNFFKVKQGSDRDYIFVLMIVGGLNIYTQYAIHLKKT